MLVIGQLSDTHQGQAGIKKRHVIQIEDYHTGHLGFIPRKKVVVSEPIMSSEGEGETEKRSCELVVSPHVISQHLFRVSCTFDEAKGVVERLVNLMSYHNINIVTMESASLFQSKYHVVNMVVDVSVSTLSNIPIMPGEWSKYIDILPNLRVYDRRGLELFLRIVSQCHEMLTWTKSQVSNVRHIPQIQISSFDRNSWTVGEVSRLTLERRPKRNIPDEKWDEKDAAHKGKKRVTYFALEQHMVDKISTLLGVKKGNPIYYALLSDTASRTLRVQFFQDKYARSLYQLGFKHKNEIGALAAIAGLVKEADFNVLMSLIRNVVDYTNVWEVLLEDKAIDWPVDRQSNPIKRIKSRLLPVAKRHESALQPYNIGIYIPSHVTGVTADHRAAEGEKNWDNSTDIFEEPADGAMVQRPQLLEHEVAAPAAQDWLVKYATAEFSNNPRVFVSCPTKSDILRDYLVCELEKNGWQPIVYDGSHLMDVTYGEARRLVADADFMVAIWDKDGDPTQPEAGPDESRTPQGRPATKSTTSPPGAGRHEGHREVDKDQKEKQAVLSPWMHFELGQAVAFEREFKVLAHRDIPNAEVIRRIAGDKTAYLFKDYLSFKHQVKNLLVFMDLNWRRTRQTNS